MSKKISATISKELEEKLNNASLKTTLSVSKLVEHCIRLSIDNVTRKFTIGGEN